MEGSILQNINGMISEMTLAKNSAVSDYYLSGISHSATLLGLFKIIIFETNLASAIPIKDLLLYFVILSLVVGVILLIYFQKYEEERWKIVTILVFCIILFNYNSFAYKLISIFIPLWMFINNNKSSKYDALYSIMFGLLLIPMRYNIFATYDYDAITYLDPIIMIVFTMLIMYEGMKSKTLVDKSKSQPKFGQNLH
jgi:hypothetical protein